MNGIQIRVNGRWTTLADPAEYDPAVHGSAHRIQATEDLVELANGQLLPDRLYDPDHHGMNRQLVLTGEWFDPDALIRDRVRVPLAGAPDGHWLNSDDYDPTVHGEILEEHKAGDPDPAPPAAEEA